MDLTDAGPYKLMCTRSRIDSVHQLFEAGSEVQVDLPFIQVLHKGGVILNSFCDRWAS